MNATCDPTASGVVEGLAALVAQARRGDRTMLPTLRDYLDAHPEIWRQGGDLAAQAQEVWLDLLAGPDLLLSESVRRKLDELRVELTGLSPSPLESLLIERVLACWLQLHYADALYPQARGSNSSASARAELLKRQESAQRRYLASIKQLAVLRKLEKPAMSPIDLAYRHVPEGTVNGIRRTACPQLRLAETS